MKRKGGGRRETLSERASKHTKAVKTLGRSNVKSGPKRIGKTAWLHPSRRGLDVLHGELEHMRRQPKDVTFTYKLIVKDSHGRVRKEHTSLVLPTAGEKRRAAKRARTARGREILEFQERIRKEIFSARPGLTTREYDKYSTLLKTSKAGARKYLGELLREKGVTFQVEIYREL